MNEYQAEKFDAMREAGITTKDALADVHVFYLSQNYSETIEARKKGWDEGWSRSSALNSWGWVAGIALAVSVVAGSLFAWNKADNAAYVQAMSDCQSGATVACLCAVQDMQMQSSHPNLTPNDSQFFDGRATAYKLAYRLKTGAELPEK